MATIFRDEFTGTGLIADHTPDVGYGGTYYINFTQTVLSGGFVTFDNSAGGDLSGGVYGDGGEFLGLLTEGTYTAVFRTLPGVPPITEFGASCISMTYGYGGESWSVGVGFYPDGSGFLSNSNDEAIPIALEADTSYTLTISFTDAYQVVRIEELDVQSSFLYVPAGFDAPDAMAGIGDTAFGVSNYGKINRIELVDIATLEPEDGAAEDGMDDGLAEDMADPLNNVSVDVVEAGVGDDLALVDGEVAPQDVFEAGVAADISDPQASANQNPQEYGVGADTALPTVMPVDIIEAGVAADTTTHRVLLDVQEVAVADGVADPVGGALLYIEDAFSEGVSADGVTINIVRRAMGIAEGIAADGAPNSYYAMPRDNGVAADAASTFLNAREIARDAGVATDAADARILQDVQDFGLAADSASLAVALTVRDAGIALDRAQSGTSHAMDVRETGVASDTALPLSFVDVREAGVAADVTLARVRTIQNVREAGVAVDAADPRRASQVQALSTGVGTDASNTQLVAYSTIVEAGVADDTGLFSRLYEAWVMNTQTTAMSRYTSLPFNSAAVIGGRVIGLGDTGFFELKGDKDGAKPIKALLKTGHLTLQSDKIKRMDDVTMGYTSNGTVSLTVAAYGGPLKGRWTYTSPPMPAASPRGTRVALGRGLQAKYYQFTIENTSGAAMSIDFARVISNEFKTRRF